MDNLLNVNQVAFILKVHPLTVRRYINEGKLKAVKIAGNIRIKESALNEFNGKEHTPKPKEQTTGIKLKRQALPFSIDDPFLRLKGRGASLNLSTG